MSKKFLWVALAGAALAGLAFAGGKAKPKDSVTFAKTWDAALAEARVNLRVIDQGSSETNIIVGVDEDDLERAVLAIYNAFENWK